MTATEQAELEQLIKEMTEDGDLLGLQKCTEQDLKESIAEYKETSKIARDLLKILPDKETWKQIINDSIRAFVSNIDPNSIPAELLEIEPVRALADQIRGGDLEQAQETVHRMSAATFLKLQKALEEKAAPESKEITRYKNVPIEVLTDFVTYQIFNRQAPSGNYVKEFKRGKKVIATLDYELELSDTAEKLGVYEKIINQSVYTLMKQTGSKTVDGAQLYRIMTNDPEAKLTPRTIENILHGIDLLTTAKIKCARVNIFDDPETPSMDVYRQIFRYDFLTIKQKEDGTPKNFQIVMTELPLNALFAEQLHQINERPFGFYQLPAGKRATKKNTSLIHELLRLVTTSVKNPELKPPNLDELMKKCGFDITDRDETKKARDLITAILKGREDTAKNRRLHPEIVIENFAGFDWKIDKRSGKRTNIKIKNTGINGDATHKNTGINRDALPKNTGINGDATRPNRNTKKAHK